MREEPWESLCTHTSINPFPTPLGNHSSYLYRFFRSSQFDIPGSTRPSNFVRISPTVPPSKHGTWLQARDLGTYILLYCSPTSKHAHLLTIDAAYRTGQPGRFLGPCTTSTSSLLTVSSTAALPRITLVRGSRACWRLRALYISGKPCSPLPRVVKCRMQSGSASPARRFCASLSVGCKSGSAKPSSPLPRVKCRMQKQQGRSF
jgi:hypothetical protein